VWRLRSDLLKAWFPGSKAPLTANSTICVIRCDEPTGFPAAADRSGLWGQSELRSTRAGADLCVVDARPRGLSDAVGHLPGFVTGTQIKVGASGADDRGAGVLCNHRPTKRRRDAPARRQIGLDEEWYRCSPETGRRGRRGRLGCGLNPASRAAKNIEGISPRDQRRPVLRYP
jgi:hypothetical protein